MDHGPVEHWDDTVVNVVRITDMPRGNAAPEHAAPLGLDALQGALAAALLPGQAVRVADAEVGVGGCAFCVAAMYRALKAGAHVSAPHPALVSDDDSGSGGGGGGGGGSGRYHEYLDVAELHYWMGAFRERISEETVRVPLTSLTLNPQPSTLHPNFTTQTPSYLEEPLRL